MIAWRGPGHDKNAFRAEHRLSGTKALLGQLAKLAV